MEESPRLHLRRSVVVQIVGVDGFPQRGEKHGVEVAAREHQVAMHRVPLNNVNERERRDDRGRELAGEISRAVRLQREANSQTVAAVGAGALRRRRSR